jgi:aryl-alcohol dehydrogenase-like predicted oxidoreductase
VALGALEIGAKYGIGEECGEVPGEEEAQELLRAAWEAGITLFDTAGIYGLSEQRIGRLLRTIEGRPVVTTKLAVRVSEGGEFQDYATERPFDSVRACVDHQVERSLENLGLDAIDVMQLHGLPGDEDVFGEMVEVLKDHVGAGRIQFLGASCGGTQVPRLIEAGCFSTVQFSYNALEQSERKGGFDLAEAHDLGVLIRSPLALGVLADKVERLDAERRARFEPNLDEFRSRLPDGMTVPEGALRFILSSPAVTSVLTGTRREVHIRENARAGDGRGLPEDVYRWLLELDERGELPEWSWSEHYQKDWPSNALEDNLELCRSVDI